MGTRYVAGISATDRVNGKSEPRYHVVRLEEDRDGSRIGQPVFVISDMTESQAEHLWMQIGRALGKEEAFQ